MTTQKDIDLLIVVIRDLFLATTKIIHTEEISTLSSIQASQLYDLHRLCDRALENLLFFAPKLIGSIYLEEQMENWEVLATNIRDFLDVM